jgi:hypothetical protein
LARELEGPERDFSHVPRIPVGAALSQARLLFPGTSATPTDAQTFMKLFACQSCQQILYFESMHCTKCGHALAYLPDRTAVCAIEPVAAASSALANGAEPPKVWRVATDPDGQLYRMCRNHTEHGVCNWAIPAEDGHEYCLACRLNHMIPNLEKPETKQAWHRLEVAKRRVLYTLFELGLPVEAKSERPNGIQFDFLQDPGSPNAPRVYTGHNDGVITINVAEADDPFRERMRVQLGEAYRTVLGHFRHEIGHYYWSRLIDESPLLPQFRELFGDETEDYAAAQERHYKQGPPADWSNHFVSAYASMHPWEDWAETWAHYLHIVDTLETARAYSLSLQPVKEAAKPATETSKEPALKARHLNLGSFEDLIEGWIPLTMALNSLNRSLGLPDVYPFVLSEAAIGKLRFVHETIMQGPAATAVATKS